MSTKAEVKYLIESEQALQALAAALQKTVTTGVTIFLDGEMGVGKTTFVRGFLRAAGYPGKVKSPTYTLVEPYEIAHRFYYHFDFYRLANSTELEQLGLEEYFTPDAVCLIEWPEKGFPYLKDPDILCQFSYGEDEERMVVLKGLTSQGKAMLGHLKYKV